MHTKCILCVLFDLDGSSAWCVSKLWLTLTAWERVPVAYKVCDFDGSCPLPALASYDCLIVTVRAWYSSCSECCFILMGVLPVCIIVNELWQSNWDWGCVLHVQAYGVECEWCLIMMGILPVLNKLCLTDCETESVHVLAAYKLYFLCVVFGFNGSSLCLCWLSVYFVF